MHGRKCSNHKSCHLARLSVLVKINLKLFPLALTPKCKVRYRHCNLTKSNHMHTCSLFFLSVYHSKCTWLIWIILENMCDQVHGYSFALGITLVFSWYWSKLPFHSATGVTPNKPFKFINWDCILFRLLWFNTFSCVYFVYCSWEHKAMFIVCFIFLCFSCCVLQK